MPTQKQVSRYQALKNMEQEFENTDSSNGENENADSSNGESEEVDVEAIKKENADLKKTNQELYERERKAKGFVRGSDGKWIKPEPKETKEEKTETKSEPLSLKDIRALQDVHDDNVDRLVSYAKFLEVDIATAKKTPEMQSYLRTEEEFRATEAAKNAGKGSRGTVKTTDAELVEQAASGNLPDDDEGIKRLAEARQAEKLAKLQK